jgi:hypothetical protein
VRLTVTPAIVGSELVRSDLADEFLVGIEESGEVKGVSRFDARNKK